VGTRNVIQKQTVTVKLPHAVVIQNTPLERLMIILKMTVAVIAAIVFAV
jgi:hypothetical protein